MSDVKRPRGLSLAWKLLLAFLAVGLIGIGTVAIIASQTTSRKLRGFVLHNEQSPSAILVGDLAAYYQAHGDWEDAVSVISGPGQRGQMGPGMGMDMARAMLLADASGEIISGPSSRQGDTLSFLERLSALPIEVGGEVAGYLIPNAMGYSSTENQLFQDLRGAFWVASLIASGVALVLGVLFVKGLLRPVNELTDAAQALASGDLSRRVEIRTNDEMGELSAAFNQMAENLEGSEERRREITADIAHELRNPLAVVKARLEAITDGVYPLTVDSIEPLLEQSELLNRLVEDLRTLAQADAGQLSLERSQTDMGQFVIKAAQIYEPEAKALEVSLNVDIPPEPPVHALIDVIRFEQILGNLLSNALSHTPSGGEVTLRLRYDEQLSKVTLEVIDTGDGIPEQDLERIFERLYRVDSSRSRQVGGSGLGLAITRKLVEAHGGSLQAQNRPQGGTVLRIELQGSRSPVG